MPLAIVRQYAVGQQIGYDVADQEIVLHYALRLLNEAGLIGRTAPNAAVGPLLFKGGTALRKCVFGSSGRFSQDIDLDATHDSYRLDPILHSRELVLQELPYFARVEFDPPLLDGLDPYEMVGEKIMACNRRVGGSAKDVYDLYLWAGRPFSEALVRRLAVLKAWTDRRASPLYGPDEFLRQIQPRNFRWAGIGGLVPRRLESEPERICATVRDRFGFLATCSGEEREIVDDQTPHREGRLFTKLRAEAQELAAQVPR